MYLRERLISGMTIHFKNNLTNESKLQHTHVGLQLYSFNHYTFFVNTIFCQDIN